MPIYELNDPNTPSHIKFHYKVGQRVCLIDANGNPMTDSCGQILNGVRNESGSGGSYDEYWEVKMDDGSVVRLGLTDITEDPSI